MKRDSALNYLTSEGLCTKLKTLNFKLNVKCKDEVEQLIKKNLQEHISKIQSLDDLRSSNFNISNIEILVQDFDLKLRIQKY